jgi:hypothetical protein
MAAAITITNDNADAARQRLSHAFAQDAKSICTDARARAAHARAPRAAATVDRAAADLAALPEPKNVHRAVARLVLHLHRGAKLLRAGQAPSKAYTTERHEAFLSAHLLNVSGCYGVLPKR